MTFPPPTLVYANKVKAMMTAGILAAQHWTVIDGERPCEAGPEWGGD